MKDLLPFISFMGFIIFQRAAEILFAKRNEKWMKSKGALEFGIVHYRWIVLVHVLFLLSFSMEKFIFNHGLSPQWLIIFIAFIFAQALRIWALASLGRYWNTKILVLPNADVIRKGPYRFIKHPNYFVVCVEILVIPLLFQAYYTACLFTVLNIMVLAIRIPEEERALECYSEYNGVFHDCRRFLPKFVK
ncbi:isoprenylcysteine carboxyl methyltransferase family protein [Neobacillus sp. SAB-20_R2A]